MFFQLTPTVRNILILNVGLAIIQAFTSTDGTMNNSPLIDTAALHNVNSQDFYPFQFFTHIFLHRDMGHILMNMLPLIFLGPMLEQTLGEKRFIIMYIVCGLGAGLLQSGINYFEVENYILTHPHYSPQSVYDAGDMVGASGAIFGILAMAGLLYPNTKIMLLFPPIPMKLKYFVMGYGAIELFAGFRNDPLDKIAHFAHIGGMLFAFILLQIWKRQARSRRQ